MRSGSLGARVLVHLVRRARNHAVAVATGLAVAASLLVSCGPAPDTDEIRLGEEVRVERRRPLASGDVAPPFAVETTTGDTIESSAVLGKRVLVVMFFTTWCKVCHRKLPIVRDVLAGYGDEVMTLAVSLDDAETWAPAPSYLRGHGLEMPLVRGALHPPFVLAYDPALAIPMVVVIGRDGRVVDAQPGLSLGDRERLRAAIEVARGPSSAAP